MKSVTILNDTDDELLSRIISIHDEVSQVQFISNSSSPAPDEFKELLKAITTKVSIFKGRHVQGEGHHRPQWNPQGGIYKVTSVLQETLGDQPR